MKVAIHGKTFLSWGGGIDLIGYFISALVKNYQTELKLYIFLPEQSFFKKIENIIKVIRRKKINYLFDKNSLAFLRSIEPDLEIIFYINDNLTDLSKKAQREKIDIICPTADPLGKNFIIPWVGYIFDLQHKYLPDFFSEREKENRDKNIIRILNESDAILVNSYFVKNGLIKFYNADYSKIKVLPFSPFLRKEWLSYNNINSIKDIPQKYLMISNQLWSHKSHITAFQALKLLEEKYKINDLYILCTGSTYDYRQPDYFNKLKEEIKNLGISEKIIFTGYIPKDEQIVLMRNSIALIQPTLFEGGPGGGSVYDAVALGIPAIVSDIKVNLEIEADNVIFFKAGDSNDLSEKIYTLLNSNKESYSTRYLLDKSLERQKEFAKKIIETINYSLKRDR